MIDSKVSKWWALRDSNPGLPAHEEHEGLPPLVCGWFSAGWIDFGASTSAHCRWPKHRFPAQLAHQFGTYSVKLMEGQVGMVSMAIPNSFTTKSHI
jgi:hypothetical protein